MAASVPILRKAVQAMNPIAAAKLEKSLSDSCADIIYRAERFICPVDAHKELTKVREGIWECQQCKFVRCTIGLRGEQK